MEATGPDGAVVTLDGSTSTDPDSTPGTNDDIVSFEWYEGVVFLGSGKILNHQFALGVHTVTLRVTDSRGQSQEDTAVITVRDSTPPTVEAGDDRTVEQRSRETVSVTLSGMASDLVDQDLEYQWKEGDTVLGESPTLTHAFDLGTHSLTLTAKDDAGNVGQDTVVVKVVDTTAPVIHGISASRTELTPVDHKMAVVTVTVTAEDLVDPQPYCWITEVTCNEPVDGPGDGNTEPDWEITGDLTVSLRAERSGSGEGRVYTIHVSCRDASGNVATATVDVIVPHDNGKGRKQADAGTNGPFASADIRLWGCVTSPRSPFGGAVRTWHTGW